MTTLAIGPAIYKTLPYDTVKDFAPVGLVGSAQFALVANPNLGAPTLPDLIALVKTKNGQMSYGTSGASTPHHLFMEMFLHQIGAKAQHVPYRGSVPALTDVISGQIPFMMVDLAVAMGEIQEGKLRPTALPRRTASRRCRICRPSRKRVCRAMRPRAGSPPWWRRHAATDHRQAQRHMMPYLGDPRCRTSSTRSRSSRGPARRRRSRSFLAELIKWGKVVKDAGIEPQ